MQSPEIKLSDSLSGDLEGGADVQLAPVKGNDIRRSLPREYFEKKPVLFLSKILLALTLIGCGWLGIDFALSVKLTWYSLLIGGVGFILCGLMYAHLIELQHECLHHHAFKSPFLNRLLGVTAGAFMLSSHSHYRYDHLRHHAYLGTDRNMEHFNYRFNNLNSIPGFLTAFFDLNRYKKVGSILVCALNGSKIEGVSKNLAQVHIKQEYIIYAALVILSIALSLYFNTWLIALAWWLPTLIIAEGAHFMIEMPEHYGLNTQTAPDVLENTRTIKTNWLAAWFVNGNHTHAAHHFHHGVPMCNLKFVHELIKPQLQIVETSYTQFFRDVISGRITHRADATCMPR